MAMQTAVDKRGRRIQEGDRVNARGFEDLMDYLRSVAGQPDDDHAELFPSQARAIVGRIAALLREKKEERDEDLRSLLRQSPRLGLSWKGNYHALRNDIRALLSSEPVGKEQEDGE